MFHRRDLLTAAVLVAVSGLAAGARIMAHPDLQWVAPPRLASCAADPGAGGALDLRRISVRELASRIDEPGVTVVDARDAAAYRAGHIPGALHLTAESAEQLLTVQTLPIPLDDLVVTYCDGGTCAVSEYMGTVLRDQAGCREVHILEGGFLEWQAAELLVTAGGVP